MFRIALIVLCLASVSTSAKAENPTNIDYPGLVTHIVQELVRHSYRKPDEDRCGEMLRTMAGAALRGEDTFPLREAAVKADCLDPHAMIAATDKEGDDPMMERNVVHSWQSHPVRYVRIEQFSAFAAEEFEAALEGLGAERIILDLRGNPGGRVSVLLQIARLFAPRSDAPILVGWYRHDSVVEKATKRGRFAGRSMLILVDRDTASAAEILALVLKRWGGRHVAIMGERTYGKSSVQACIACDALVQVRATVGLIAVGDPFRNVVIHGVGVHPTLALTNMTAPGPDRVLGLALRYYGIRPHR